MWSRCHEEWQRSLLPQLKSRDEFPSCDDESVTEELRCHVGS
jgi:hypothetical protein